MGRGRVVWGLAVLAAALACTTVEEGDGGLGTTNGGSTTTGGTVGPPDNTVCLNGGPGNTATADEFTPCGLNRDCICPLDCLADAPRLGVLGPSGTSKKFCERGCGTSADCPLPSEVCVPRGDAGVCLEIPCGPILSDGGLLDGDLGATCDALATGDGTCTPNEIAAISDPLYDAGDTTVIIANGMPSACWLAGTSSSSCDLTALPTDTANRCPAGEGCDLLASDGLTFTGVCLPSCDPAASGQCASGSQCEATPILVQAEGLPGFCYASGTGGCLTGLPASQSELFFCKATKDCACPETCIATPTGIGKWCARACATTADCPNPSTGCAGGTCAYAPCGAQALGACDYRGSADGTCIAADFSWAAAGPHCVAAGSTTEGGVCSVDEPQTVHRLNGGFVPTGDVTFVSAAASQFCAPGLLCIDDGTGQGTGKCRKACNEQITPGLCGGGNTVCYTLDPSGFGFCHGCHGGGNDCTFPSDCCSGSCSDGQCQ